MDITTLLSDHATLRKVILTLAVVVLAFLSRAVLVRWLRANGRMTSRDRLRWSAHARSLALGLVVLGLFFLWAEELGGFALSIVAIAAALVLATRELFMCVSGALLRATTRSFDIGDRIEVHGYRGDVIDTTLLGTTVLEIGPGHQRTGRAVTIPNSLFLTDAVVNETFTDEFVLHIITIPCRAEDAAAAEDRVLEIATEVAGGIVDEAKKRINEAGRRHGLSTFVVAPRVTLQMVDADTVNLLVRVPVRAREKGRIEQLILRRYLGEDEERISRTDPESTGF
jgi:small-conductance mechanosensitive channel